jgi:hypothetical protein
MEQKEAQAVVVGTHRIRAWSYPQHVEAQRKIAASVQVVAPIDRRSQPDVSRVFMPVGIDPKEVETLRDVAEFARDLMNYAAYRGVVVTIERAPIKPLAMGSSYPVCHVYRVNKK